MLLIKNLTRRGKIYLIIVILSFVFAYLIVPVNSFPQSGLALTFTAFALMSYILIKGKTKETGIFFTFVLLFSLGLAIRSEPSVLFFDLVAVLFYGLLMLVPGISGKQSLAEYVYLVSLFMVSSVFTVKSDYYPEYKARKKIKKGGTIRTILGILITIVVMSVVLPLLSSVNPFFQKIVGNIINILNIENFIKAMGLETAVIWIVRLVFFSIFLFLIPKILTLINMKKENQTTFSLKLGDFPLTIPKVFLAIVILIFIITQLQFYFASDTTLANLGVSHSQRTREVFSQLSVVAGIIMILIYNSSGKDNKTKFLNWTLGISGIFLTLMAYRSVFEYVGAWGLTYKRLYGFTFATWVLGIFILFFENYKGNNINAWFIKKSIIFTGVMLLIVNVLNFDYLIYYFDKAKTGRGTDYSYLSGLSADSLSYKEQYELLEKAKNLELTSEVYDNQRPLLLIYKISSLQIKYSELDFRSFSLLEYIQYLKIKDVNTENLRQYYLDKLPPPEF